MYYDITKLILIGVNQSGIASYVIMMDQDMLCTSKRTGTLAQIDVYYGSSSSTIFTSPSFSTSTACLMHSFSIYNSVSPNNKARLLNVAGIYARRLGSDVYIGLGRPGSDRGMARVGTGDDDVAGIGTSSSLRGK